MARLDQPPPDFIQDEPVPDIPLPPEDEPEYRRRRSSYESPPYMPGGYVPYPYQEQQSYSWSQLEPSNQPLEENLIKSYWRPAMAWQYFLVCVFDFLIGPALTIWFYSDDINRYNQWEPITLQHGGIYHMAMGVIIGIYVWSRGKEKINRMER